MSQNKRIQQQIINSMVDMSGWEEQYIENCVKSYDKTKQWNIHKEEPCFIIILIILMRKSDLWVYALTSN